MQQHQRPALISLSAALRSSKRSQRKFFFLGLRTWWAFASWLPFWGRAGGPPEGWRDFFFPPVWPIRTRLGPYNCVSSEKQECTRTRVVQKLRQIITKTTTNKKQKKPTTKNDPQIPQPDLRFATKQNSEATKNGAGPNKNQKKYSDLP